MYIYIWPHCVACGILVPQSGIEAAPPAAEAQSPNLWTAREVLVIHIYTLFFIVFFTMVYLKVFKIVPCAIQ